jgi:hypothetical protein
MSWLISTLVLALMLFGVGVWVARKLGDRPQFWFMAVAGSLASVPAVVFAVYYLKVFDEPLWLYQLPSNPSLRAAAPRIGTWRAHCGNTEFV